MLATERKMSWHDSTSLHFAPNLQDDMLNLVDSSFFEGMILYTRICVCQCVYVCVCLYVCVCMCISVFSHNYNKESIHILLFE